AHIIHSTLRARTPRCWRACQAYSRPIRIVRTKDSVDCLEVGGGRQRDRNARVPAEAAAFRKNAAAGPAAATTKPPIAGPTDRATLNPALLATMAFGTCDRLTTSGRTAAQVGELMAEPRPRL